MLNKLAKGFPYGAIIFLIVAFITHAATSPDWYQGGKIVVHTLPLALSIAFGFATCGMFGYYLNSSVGSGLEPALRSIFLYPLGIGILVFVILLGGGGFTLMSESDRIITACYRIAFSAGVVASIVTLFIGVLRLLRKGPYRPA